jgi:hypothetical protein
MESRTYPLLRQPLTEEDLNDDLNVLPIPDDVLQLQVDALNVLENRVDINDFPEDYQEKIKEYYRFSATRMTTDNSKIAKRTVDTLDIV